MGKYKKELVRDVCAALSSYGYKVYLSKNGEYGFYTDGKRVVSFGGSWEFSLDFSGNYSSRNCGTGWQIAADQGIPTEEEARCYITDNPPFWATGGERVILTTPEQHLTTYGKSSGYSIFGGQNV